jgi:hypothetical protein
VALGVAELTAAITGPRGTPVVAAGETAINLTPVAVKDFAIAHFGSHDKEALIIGIVVLLVGFAALIGMLAVRRIAYGLAGLAIFAGVGVAAAAHLPNANAADVMPRRPEDDVNRSPFGTKIFSPERPGSGRLPDGTQGSPGDRGARLPAWLGRAAPSVHLDVTAG